MDNKHPVEQVVLRERFVYHLLSRRVKQGLNLCDLILSAGINHINTEYLIVHSHESITICKPEELGLSQSNAQYALSMSFSVKPSP